MSSPSLSVILPIYNADRYLGESIDSILRQTYRDFELLALDDGSTDDSLKLLREFAAQDSRIIVISRKNLGLVATLNEGLAIAQAPLIARMDADDIAVPERFAQQVAYMQNYPQCVALGSAIRFIDQHGTPGAEASYPRSSEVMRRLISEGSMLAHPAVMMRKNAAVKAGGYRPAFQHAEDYDLWLRMAEIGTIDNLPEVLLLYRQHSQQVSTKHAFAQTFGTAVARSMALLRAKGPEPFLNADRPLTINDLSTLPINRNEKKRICIELLATLLRPDMLREPARRHDLYIVIQWLNAHAPEVATEPAFQSLIWPLVLRSWQENDRRGAIRCASFAIFRGPLQAIKVLLRKMKNRIRNASRKILR